MTKKAIVTTIIVIVLVLVAGIAGYWYWQSKNNNPVSENAPVETSTNSSPQIQQNSQVQVQNPVIKSVPNNPANTNSSLSVCADQCGDGICQTKANNCAGDGTACICIESHADCPQDCK